MLEEERQNDLSVRVIPWKNHGIDTQGNLCIYTRRNILVQGGVWHSPYYWEAYAHIEEIVYLPDDLVWLRTKDLYRGTDYTQEEWEEEERQGNCSYEVATRAWLQLWQERPISQSKVWSFDDHPPLTSSYPFLPPVQRDLFEVRNA